MKNLKKFNSMGRRRLMGGVVGLGLVALLGAGALTQSALTSHERTLHAPPGKLVSVGTHRLHLNCQGSGQPLVLLESGLSGWSQDWALVQPELAKLTTVCSYDRAGYAWSDDAPESRTGLLAVQDLRTMLRAAGLQGPMVVVGHSWGGMLAQMLAQTNSEEVAGLVLVDALHHDQTASMDPDVHARYSRNMRFLTGSATWLAPLGLTRLAGMPASVVLDKLPASEQVSARALAMQSKNYRALYTEYMGIDPALAVARSLPPVPAVPTIVLSTHALSEFPPGWELDYMRQHWIAGQRALARETAAKHVVVADAGHYLQLERAELVIASVQEVLQKVRLTSPMVSK
ncbi:MAG: alpha/beta hydrolase [Rhodoferax sp.]|nr:alpha/beta hydrolase [Rhodoferax sp.]